MKYFSSLFKNTRIIILLLFLLFSVIAIHPSFDSGVAIRGVQKDSPAFTAGMLSPKASASLTSREIITSLNGIPIHTLEDYYEAVNKLSFNTTVLLETDVQAYRITPEYQKKIIFLNETAAQEEIKSVYNETLNASVNVTSVVYVPKKKVVLLTDQPLYLGLTVQEAATTNIRKGLDLQGGTRVLLQPVEKVSSQTLDTLIASMEQRLNVYGVSDVSLRPVVDFDGNQFIVVEIAGTTEEEIKNLLASQGKFEAKIANKTVFVGGTDITYVCRTADCSGIDPSYGCRSAEGGIFCRFFFSIALSPAAAQRQADITQTLPVLSENGQQYLSEKLELYLDDVLVDSLSIGADLKGRAVSDIAISGGGGGATQDAARTDALSNMKRLQTVLVTGSLPVKLEIVKVDAISPSLGKEFSKSVLLMMLVSAIGVMIVIYIKYRQAIITIPIAITLISEVLGTLGVAALFGWNMDLAAIAGIIVAVGTGVSDQIVITDETLRGEQGMSGNWKQRVKKAFFIVMAAYSTNIASMIPLLFAGAGLLKGFALTTIIGLSVGVLITRPAYGAMLEILLKEKSE